MLRRHLPVLLLLALAGCATQRTSQPRITATPRSGLSLQRPILVSVLDARSSSSKSEDAGQVLEEDLKKVYGSSIELADYFSEVPEGRVALRLRLKANEANFGSRILSVSTIEQSYTEAESEVVGPWSSVVATASSTNTTLGTSIVGEGWWVGTSWIEFTVIDHRGDQRKRFSVPIVAEQKRQNTFGYQTADQVTEDAWGQVEQQLLQLMDKVVMTVRNRE